MITTVALGEQKHVHCARIRATATRGRRIRDASDVKRGAEKTLLKRDAHSESGVRKRKWRDVLAIVAVAVVGGITVRRRRRLVGRRRRRRARGRCRRRCRQRRRRRWRQRWRLVHAASLSQSWRGVVAAELDHLIAQIFVPIDGAPSLHTMRSALHSDDGRGKRRPELSTSDAATTASAASCMA